MKKNGDLASGSSILLSASLCFHCFSATNGFFYYYFLFGAFNSENSDQNSGGTE